MADGTIDVIATDHAPHAKEKKMQELDQAPFGVVGLETALGLVVTKLIRPGHLDWSSAIQKMTVNPARILGISKGTLAIGADADITIINPDVRWKVDPARVPLEKHELALHRLGTHRPGRNGHRRRPGEIQEGLVVNNYLAGYR